MSTNDDIRRQIALLSGAIRQHQQKQSRPRLAAPGTSLVWRNPAAAAAAPGVPPGPAHVLAPAAAPRLPAAQRRGPPAPPARGQAAVFRPSRNLKLINASAQAPGQQPADAAGGSEPATPAPVSGADGAHAAPASQQISFISKNNKLVRVGFEEPAKRRTANPNPLKRRIGMDATASIPKKPASRMNSVHKKLIIRNGIAYYHNGRSMVAATALTDSDREFAFAMLPKKPPSAASASGAPASGVPEQRIKVAQPFGRPKSMSLRRVAIGGVEFMLDVQQHKLVRVTDGESRQAADAAKATPKRVVLNGVQFVRSKRGNLILASTKRANIAAAAAAAAAGASAAPKPRVPRPASFSRARYTHDPRRLALCPSKLKTGSCADPQTCKLSHEPTEQTTPFCVYFESRRCTNERCPYLHVKLSPGAPVCSDFANEGFCERGSSCMQRHVFLCPDFDKDGKCPRGDKCRLPHRDKKAARGSGQRGSAGAGSASGSGAAASGGGGAADVEDDNDIEELLLPRRPDFSQIALEQPQMTGDGDGDGDESDADDGDQDEADDDEVGDVADEAIKTDEDDEEEDDDDQVDSDVEMDTGTQASGSRGEGSEVDIVYIEISSDDDDNDNDGGEGDDSAQRFLKKEEVEAEVKAEPVVKIEADEDCAESVVKIEPIIKVEPE
ncbi:hypothetical protein HK105_203911 [Polyrhizophydium stewartii]|uniref:C3H1-type domain-containing protein n=1 Tax=Polyrhizophydium stewartii TaxID=2732419 RepID=A0ABR4NAC5_9FUNG